MTSRCRRLLFSFLGFLSAARPAFADAPDPGETGVPPFREMTGDAAPDGAVWLDQLDLSLLKQGWGAPRPGRSLFNRPMRLAGTTFRHGIATRPVSEFVVDLGEGARRFRTAIGVDDECGRKGSVVFVVYLDDREIFRSGVMRGGDDPKFLDLDIAGGRLLGLIVEDGGDGVRRDHADWAGAHLVPSPGIDFEPRAVPVPEDPPPPIGRIDPVVPEIHAPRIVGAAPGRPFLFRIPCTGKRPLRFAAEDLPAGLELDPDRGIIRGALEEAGTNDVRISVSGPGGRDASVLRIVGGERRLARTPPMGWSSWSVWGTTVDQPKVVAALDALVEKGLADVGYRYVVVDDGWQGGRVPISPYSEKRRIVPDGDRFGDMKALAEQVHERGLLFGLFTSGKEVGPSGRTSSGEKEIQDTASWIEWRIDLLRYEEDPSRSGWMPPLRRMTDAFDEAARDVLVWLETDRPVDAWLRTSPDSRFPGFYVWSGSTDPFDSWTIVCASGFGQEPLADVIGPGRWGDPGPLMIGKIGWGEEHRPSRLTPNEQITQMTLWSMLAAPLMIGCDLVGIDDFSLAILSHPEVIEVDQDPLGRPGRCRVREGTREIWSRPLADGSTAVAVFNRGYRRAGVVVRFRELGLKGPLCVRDLWRREEMGTFEEEFRVETPRHGAVLLKVRPPSS